MQSRHASVILLFMNSKNISLMLTLLTFVVLAHKNLVTLHPVDMWAMFFLEKAAHYRIEITG